MDEILNLIDKERLFADSEHIYNIAEIGFNLTKTKEYVKKSLKEIGIEPMDCGRCGIKCVLGSENNERVLLLRADMDAIFIEGKGNMHACGHHMHTAMLLGAARVLKKLEDRLNSCVVLMFQPAEEILEGAKDMIDSGILESPKPNGAFMIHVSSGNTLPAGTVVFADAGEIAPSADFFTIKIKGKGCHGADPSKGVDPVLTASHVVCALGIINSRELSCFEPAVITFGCVNGGNSANAIPEEVTLKGTVRSYSEENREFVKKRMEEITSDVCRALRCQSEIIYEGGCPPFLNDKELLNKISGSAKKFLGEDKVVMLKDGQKGGGSEDFAYVSRQIPTVMASLAAGEISKGHKYPLHNPNVTFDKNARPVGSALMAHIALNY